MRTAAVAFVLSLVTAAVLTPVARRLARRIGAIDHALSSRKIHVAPIPRLGGIAIVCAFFAPLTALLFANSGVGRLFVAEPREVVGLFAGGTIIAALGIYDDLKGAGAKTKFTVQFAVAGLMYALGYRIDQIANPFGAPIPLGLLGLPFTLLWIAGIINAINLIDGLDGLAGGVALVKVGITFVFALLHGDPLMVLFTASLAGAILGFLRYNFNPATIFMGDTGSMFLGFVLATTAIQTHQKSATAVAILVPIIALGLPIADTLLAMGRRAARGAPLFQADREHIHHRLLARGLTQRQTALVLYAVSAFLGGVAVALAYATSAQAALLLAALGVLGWLVLRGLGYMRFERTTEVLEVRRRNLELRSSIREIADRLRHAAEVGDVWEGVQAAAPAVGATCVGFRITEPRRGPQKVRHYSCGFDEAGPELLRSRHSLLGERPDTGTIEFGWTDGRSTLDRDTEIAIELLCEHVLHAVGRLEHVRAAPRALPTASSDAESRRIAVS